MKTIAITGAGGFIGSELCNFFREKGFRVLALNKNMKEHFSTEHIKFFQYRLEDAPPFDELRHADVIIHCAFMKWSAKHPDADEINVKATIALADHCEKTDKQFIFLSSFSAHENATSHYGKHKFLLEQRLKDKHLVIKPGLVRGKKGLFASLENIVQTKKIIPLIGDGRQPIQWISADELCEAIASALEKNLKGVYPVASQKSITFLQLLQVLARRNQRNPLFIHVPVWAASLLLKITGGTAGFSAENLNGLLQLKEFDTQKSLEVLQIRIKDLD